VTSKKEGLSNLSLEHISVAVSHTHEESQGKPSSGSGCTIAQISDFLENAGLQLVWKYLGT